MSTLTNGKFGGQKATKKAMAGVVLAIGLYAVSAEAEPRAPDEAPKKAMLVDSLDEASVNTRPRERTKAPEIRAPEEDMLAPAPAVPHQNDPRARTAHHGLYAELLGNGLYYSINYEHFFRDDFSVRGGFGYTEQRHGDYSFFGSNGNPFITELMFPVLANYYVGGPDHKLKLGAGATVFYWSGPTQGFLSPEQNFSSGAAGLHAALTLAVGYRYVPHRGGVSFGVTFTPLIERSVLPWGGIDVGAAF